MTDITVNDQRYDKDHWICQQDGAPPHYALRVRQYLDQCFARHWNRQTDGIPLMVTGLLRLPVLSLLHFFVGTPKQ